MKLLCIKEIHFNFRSLKDFPDGSRVSEYNEVLNVGLVEGLSACMSKFSMCDEESYQLVKKAQVDDEGKK